MNNHTSKTYSIGDPISAGTFRKYIEHFYNGHLRLAGEKFLQDGRGAIERPTFVAVAHSLLATGDFKTGERFRLSQVAIAEISGCSPKSVRRVLRLLEKLGAIRVVETSKRPGGGMPVKVYTLTYSDHVHAVLSDQDRNKARDQWKRPQRAAQASDTREQNPSALGTTTPINRDHNPNQWGPQPHNRNPQDQERTDSDRSSPAPLVAEPLARSGADRQESDADWMDELLSEIGALPMDGLSEAIEGP
ncbi:hypothetical protein [Microbacterium sp. CR_7]|uniref:hypothetical protein n=1 Tax=Microbacterium sp. CR_7 TaxID=3055792 RepID=UPI0035BEBD62